MTKIVYNACFGGFSLSDEAMKRYGELKGMNLVWVPNERWPTSGLWYRDGIKNDDNYVSVYDFDRDDPVLVQVVEELGDRANGEHAKLRIANISKGTKYRIDEYDGNETVMTVDDYDWNIA